MLHKRLSLVIPLILMLLISRAFGAQAKTIAIMYFENKSLFTELDPFQKSLPRMLMADLSQIPGLEVVERERLEKFLQETELGELGVTEEETAQRMGKALGADFLIWGSFQEKDSGVELEVKIQEVSTKQFFPLEKLSAGRDQLLQLEKELVEEISKVLKVNPQKETEPLTGEGRKRHSLAILDFENYSLSSRLDPLEVGLPYLLMEELLKARELNVVERKEIDQVLKELELNLSGMVEKEMAIKVGRMLGAEVMVLGWFMESGHNLRIDIQLVDVETGIVISTESALGKTEKFYELEKDLALKIVDDMKIKLKIPERKMLEEPVTKSLEAAIYFSQGRCLLRRKWRYQDAIRQFEKALFLDPNFAPAQEELAIAYEVIDRNRAIQEYQKFLDRFPDHPLVPYILMGMGRIYYKKGEYNKAIEYYRKVVDNYPQLKNTPCAQYRMAQSYRAMGDWERASREYERIIEKYPYDYYALSAHNTIARYYERQGEYDKAKEQYQKMVEKWKDKPSLGFAARWGHGGLASIYRRERRYDLALEELERARDADNPEYAVNSQLRIVEFYRRLGQSDKARQAEDEARAMAQRLAEKGGKRAYWGYNRLAWYYYLRKEWPRTTEAYELAVKAATSEGGENYSLQYMLNYTGDGYEKQGLYDQAIVAYQKAVKCLPRSPIAFEIRQKIGEILLRQKKYQEAISLLEGVMANFPESLMAARAQKNLGEYYESLGQLNKALQFYEEALRLFEASLNQDKGSWIERIEAKEDIENLKRKIANLSSERK